MPLDQITITLDLPRRVLSKNAPQSRTTIGARVRGARMTEARRLYRGSAKLHTIAANPNDERWQRAEAHVTFHFPNRRPRDVPNFLAALAPAWDGIVDAHLIPGDHWACLSLGAPKVEIDPDNPRVEITLRRVES